MPQAATIDLHNHTYFSSDGEGSPEAGLDRVKELGIHAFAYTEHHIPLSLERAQAHAKTIGVEYIRGVELSGEDPVTGHCIDVLGYFLGDDLSPVYAYGKKLNSLEHENYRRIFESLPRVGYRTLNWDDYRHALRERYPDAPGREIGGKTILQYWIEVGLAQDLAAAKAIFQKARQVVADRMQPFPPIQEAIEALRKTRALMVVAHPMLYSLNGIVPDEAAKGWRELGVHGLEAIYGADPAKRQRWQQVAKKYDFCLSSGSDCHHVCAPNSQVGFLKCPYSVLEEMKERHALVFR